MKLFNFCNKVIEYSFYLIFFLVPLALTGDTSELFEFNKLWVTFILTIIIAFSWITKMVIKKQIRIQKTPLDIPIFLFLGSQLISTLISLDTHVSLWGYYSRFNGGFFSIFAYVFLYYAFVSNYKDINSEREEGEITTKRILIFVGAIIAFAIGSVISSKIQNAPSAGIPFQLISTLVTALISFVIFMLAAPMGFIKRTIYSIFSSLVIVVLWGLPSHFGYDPTCLLFRGTLDVSCWTTDFQPKIRIFSTLGQPDWMGAYLATLLPVLAAILINFIKEKNPFHKLSLKNNNLLVSLGLLLLFTVSYLCLLFTVSRSAIFSFWVGLLTFLAFYFWFYIKPHLKSKKLSLDFKLLIASLLIVAGVTFAFGTPFSQLDIFTLRGISTRLQKPSVTKTTKTQAPAPVTTPTYSGELGGTDSGIIRGYVWRGAMDIWKNYPVFGSGVETYAFAYYKFRPIGHNMTSEWNYLYNKAHNEFLNYLATTGAVGLLTYLSIILGFFYLTARYLYKQKKDLGKKELLIASFLAGYIAIQITNFLGFSVVIMNIFLFIIVALVFIEAKLLNFDNGYQLNFAKHETYELNLFQKVGVLALAGIALYLINYLVIFWNSDRNYYFGYNFDRAQDYQRAYPFLLKAVTQSPNEPVYRDEYAFNTAVLGAAILSQNQNQNNQQNSQIGKQLLETGINSTNQVTTEHPNNIVFWKTKVRIFYTIAQIDPSYYTQALNAIKTSATLAPTDPDVFYNLGVLYGQTGDAKNAVANLEKTIQLKPDYKGGQAYYALGIFYRQLSVDSKGKVVNEDYNKKAIEEIKLMEKLFGKSQQAEDALKAWGAQ